MNARIESKLEANIQLVNSFHTRTCTLIEWSKNNCCKKHIYELISYFKQQLSLGRTFDNLITPFPSRNEMRKRVGTSARIKLQNNEVVDITSTINNLNATKVSSTVTKTTVTTISNTPKLKLNISSNLCLDIYDGANTEMIVSIIKGVQS